MRSKLCISSMCLSHIYSQFLNIIFNKVLKHHGALAQTPFSLTCAHTKLDSALEMPWTLCLLQPSQIPFPLYKYILFPLPRRNLHVIQFSKIYICLASLFIQVSIFVAFVGNKEDPQTRTGEQSGVEPIAAHCFSH